MEPGGGVHGWVHMLPCANIWVQALVPTCRGQASGTVKQCSKSHSIFLHLCLPPLSVLANIRKIEAKNLSAYQETFSPKETSDIKQVTFGFLLVFISRRRLFSWLVVVLRGLKLGPMVPQAWSTLNAISPVKEIIFDNIIYMGPGICLHTEASPNA